VGQASNESLPEQERKVAGVAMYHGLGLTEVVTEPGVSGSVAFAKRPASGALMGRLVAGDTLIVSKLDRAFRDAEDALATSRELHERGVRLIVADIGVEPVTENGTGKLFFTLLSAFAEFERQKIRERTEDGRRAKKAKGGYIGGRAGFGYRIEGSGDASKVVPYDEEQEQVRWILERHAAGESSRRISEGLSERGFRLSHVAVCRVINQAQA
jgi:DNA invertase Pin-like site-specific DNA recombinase